MSSRFVFVMEQGLGHVTHGLNLKSVLREEDQFAASVLEVRPGETRGVKPLPWVRNWSVQTSWAARRSMLANGQVADADAIFIHTQCAALFASRIMQRTPTVVSLDATPLGIDTMADTYNHSRQAPPVEWVKLRINRRALMAAKAVVTWSHWAAGSVIGDYGIPADRVHVVPPGVQIDKFQPQKSEGRSAPLRVLFVGGDFVRKGGPELVHAVASLQGAAELDVVTATSGIAIPRGAPIRVHHGITPNSEQIRDLFARADVFALPTHGDCHSLAIVEAMACGLPILTTNVGSSTEIVQDRKNGFIVKRQGSTDVAAALRVLASDPDLRHRMGRASRALAITNHDTAANWKKIFDLLQRISGSHGRVTNLSGSSRLITRAGFPETTVNGSTSFTTSA